jgi:hypothetical protein
LSPIYLLRFARARDGAWTGDPELHALLFSDPDPTSEKAFRRFHQNAHLAVLACALALYARTPDRLFLPVRSSSAPRF